ncbi:hypothetical protein MRX96_028974 [Rhipicephalus microplus]
MTTMSVYGEDITQQEYENEADPNRGPDRGLDRRPPIPGLHYHKREEDPKAQKDRVVSVAPRDPSSLVRNRFLPLSRDAVVLVFHPVVLAGRWRAAIMIVGFSDFIPGSGSLVGGGCVATASLGSQCRPVERARHGLRGLRG